MKPLRAHYPILFVVLLACAYALLNYFAFTDWLWSGPFGALTSSFLLGLPFALGATTAFLAPKQYKASWPYAVFMPWFSIVAFAAFLVMVSLELLVCVVMALPIMFAMASAAGLLVWLVMRKSNKVGATILLLALAAPFAGGPVEAQATYERKYTTTHTQIRIEASTEAVWENIKTVPEIDSAEHSPNWLHLVGLPKPVAATLSHEGLGGVRDATFEGGLRFDETITEWEHHKRIRFTIRETSDVLLPAPLSLIGTEQFDVVEGVYEIEQLEDGAIMLHLSSEHFLSTQFNEYGSFWTDLIMRDLQNYILEIVKARAEG